MFEKVNLSLEVSVLVWRRKDLLVPRPPFVILIELASHSRIFIRIFRNTPF